ncbi:hypothetical protein Tco_0887502 [Tanacetum coccineum]
MDDTIDQFDNDARLEEPTETTTGIVQGEGNDTEMTEAQQGNENLKTTQEQVVEDAHVIISTVPKKTEVLVTSSSRSSDLAFKFLKFSDIPQTDAEIVSPLDVHVHHEVPRTQAPTLLTIPVSVIPKSSHTFTPTPIQATPTPPPTIETTNPLSNLPDFSSVFRFNDRITALEKEVVDLKKDPLQLMSNFAPLVIEKLIKESRDEVTLAKVSSQPQSTYEAASTLTEFELKKILLDKMEKSESYLTALEHRDCYDGLKKSYALDKYFFYPYDVYSLKRGRKDKDKDEDPSARSDRGLKKRKTSKDVEPTKVFEVADSDMPQDQAGNLGDNEDEPRDETASRRDWFKKPTPPQEPTDPDWNVGKTTKEGPAFRLLKGTRSNYVELEYDFEECYKALSEKLHWENPEGGDYPFDLFNPLPLITRGKCQRVPFEFFINNDLKYLQGGISTMTYTTSTTKTKAAKYDLPGIEDMVPNIRSPVNVAYDKYALWVTHVSVMRKHRYWYLEEIVVRRADNVLYRFKEGNFSRLRINNIEDMLILMVQNRLTNLLGYDVADFAIALRMFIRSLPDTTRPDIRKRHPYTPYKDPQGFIYVDDIGRNRLMRTDELYKFSDGTLTRLLSSLEDITKNIDMTYLPKRRWSNLEKKRAHFMIKDINKLLKERRMMKSLEKFVGGRLYGTDLRLPQRTI